jgi:hypothetical protein
MTTLGEGASDNDTHRNKHGSRQEEKSAEQPHWIAYVEGFCAVLLVCITGTYTYYSAGQLHKMRRSTDAAEKAANVADQTLKLSNRPWIQIKHRVIQPLNFDSVGASGGAATMTAEDTIENVGNGVALNVVSWEDVIPLDPDMSTMSARKRQAEWCNANKRFDPKSPHTIEWLFAFPQRPARSGF